MEKPSGASLAYIYSEGLYLVKQDFQQTPEPDAHASPGINTKQPTETVDFLPSSGNLLPGKAKEKTDGEDISRLSALANESQIKTILPATPALPVMKPAMNASEQAKVAAPPAKLNYSGEYLKKVLVITPGLLTESDTEFLYKILAAVKLAPADIALASLSDNAGISAEAMVFNLKPASLLTFGLAALPMVKAKYVPFEFGNANTLQADGVDLISGDQALKRKLWEALKTIFA
ncbi:MAG: hypothetical protein V4543_04925 [Bacteroidota bacterium]